MTRMYELITDERIDFSESFLNEVFELLLKEDEDLKRYISDFKSDYTISTLGAYNNKDKTIMVNPLVIQSVASAI